MEVRQADTDVPGPVAPAPAANAPPARRGRLVAAGMLLAALVAVAGSWWLRDTLADDETTPPPADDAPITRKIEIAGNATDLLERGDKALALYRFGQARAAYEELLRGQSDRSPIIAYRIGLCHEALGQLEQAQTAYRTSVGAASSTSLKLAAHLGIARCLLRGHHPADTRRLLSPYLLDETQRPNAPATLTAGLRYLVALASAEQALHRAPSSEHSADDAPVSFTSVTLEMPFYLDDLGPAAKGPSTKLPTVLSVRKQADSSAALVSCCEHEQPVRLLLDRIAGEAGWQIRWSAAAEARLSERDMGVAVRDWPLVEFLEQATDRFDLVCQVEKDGVKIWTAEEMDAHAQLACRRGAARRALRAALQADPGHPWASAAMLELGNAEADDGKPAKAAIWFERVLRTAPASTHAAAASFNLGLLHIQKQEYVLARKAWYRVVDQVPGHELALRAYLGIARSHLENEDAREAIVQLRRALKLAPGSSHCATAALLLAAAHLHADEPEPARLALAQHRAALLADSSKSMAIFLSAYADYQLAKKTGGGRREAGDLLNSLWQRPDDQPLGAVGQALIARAYLDLGFADQAEQRLRQALQTTNGPFAHALEYRLAQTCLKQGRRADAIPIMTKLAGSVSPYQTKARFELARVDLQERRFAACEEKCRQLWREGKFANAAELFQVWGHALDGLGEHARAAKVFAGTAPD